MSTTDHTATADDYRARAQSSRDAAHDSFERSDTDGFVSQWASGLDARKNDMSARIADNGGRWEFDALFTLDGALVPAKLVDTRYGMSWAILDGDDARARYVGWFNPSRARKASTRNRNDARKGYAVGRVLAPAYADYAGGGTGLAGAMSVSVVARRADGGFSRDVEIVSTSATVDYDY